MRLLHRLLLCLFIAVTALPAVAQNTTTTITLQHLIANGAPVANAEVCATPADINGNAINVSSSGWGFVLKSHPFCANVVNGALPDGLPVPDAAHTTAASSIRYNISIQVKNANGVSVGQAVLINAIPNVTGTTFPLDDYTPTVSTAAYPAGLIYTSGVPSGCSSPSVVIDQVGGAAYFCVAGSLQPLTIASTTTHADSADTATTASTATTATNANHATTADSATTATTATNANHATTADSATTATTATTATNATHATTADSATTATTATTASALAATPGDCGSEAATGINADGSPKSCVAVGASTVIGTQYRIAGYTGTGGGSSTALGQTNATTDATGNPLYVPGSLTGASVSSFNPNLPLLQLQGHAFYANNYFQTDASGNVNGGFFEPHNPGAFDDYEHQRQMCCDAFTPYNFTLHIPTGGFNDSSSNGNMNSVTVGLDSQTSYQGGGQLSLQNSEMGQGDDVLIEFNQAGTGAGRGNDEYTETYRGYTSENPATFGGTFTLGTLTAQGNQPMQFALVGGAGYSFAASGEHRLLIDLTQKWSSGNISNVTNKTIGGLPFIEVTLDSASGYTAKWGASTVTVLTNPINNDVWTGTCPNWTDTSTPVPSGNAFIDDRTGVNLYHQQNPGLNSPAAWCVAVTSTAGMSAGDLVYITDGTVDAEYTTVTSVVDATHFVANIKRQKLNGAVVSWGGGVGTGISNGYDDRAPGFYNGGDGAVQTAETRLVYPVVYSEAGNKAVIDVTGNGSAYEMKTLGYGANTAVVPLTISATVVSGVITAISSNYTSADFTANVIGGIAGGQTILPPPTLTYTCGTNPVITFTYLPDGGAGLTHPTYQPTLVSGGSSCTGSAVTVNAETPNPLNVYPATFIYKTTDPASTDPKTWSSTGYILTEPIDTSLWTNGDQSEETRWWQSFVGWGHVTVTGEPDTLRSTFIGSHEQHAYAWEHGGTPHMQYDNLTPFNYYFGTAAGGWQKSSNPADASIGPGPLQEVTGGSGGLVTFDIPPTGSIIDIKCTLDFSPGQDAPCAHGILGQQTLLVDENGGVIVKEDPNTHQIIVGTPENPRTGTMTYGLAAPTGITTGSAIGIEGMWAGQALIPTLLTQTLGHTYSSFGNGSQGDSRSLIGAGEFAAGTLVAGATLPNVPNVEVGGTPGSTTYTYACTGVSSNGGQTVLTANGTTNTGNATLSGTNFIQISCFGNVGDQYVNVYRTSTTGGLTTGLICQNVVLNRNDEHCFDTGQTPSAALPSGPDTSSQLMVAGVTFTAVQGNAGKVAAASGSFTAGNVRSTDSSGNAVDGGVAVSSLCQSNGTNCASVANVPLRWVGTVTLTAAGPDALTVTGLTSANHCSTSYRTTTGTPVVLVAAPGSGSLSITHGTATAGDTVDAFCDLL